MSKNQLNDPSEYEFDLQKESASKSRSSIGHVPWLIRLSILASILLIIWSFAAPMRTGILQDADENPVHRVSRSQGANGHDIDPFKKSENRNRVMDIPIPTNAEENARIVEQAREEDRRLLARIRTGKRDSHERTDVPGRDEAIEHYRRYRDRVLKQIKIAESDGGHVPEQFRDQLKGQLEDRP